MCLAEPPGRLSNSQIAAIQWDYANGFTPEQIIKVTGVKRATVYRYIRGVEQHPHPTVENQTLTPAPDPPASSLSQPPSMPSAPPPKIVEVIDSTENQRDEAKQREREPYGAGYGSYGSYQREGRRPTLPVTDSETISQLLLILGRDMRKRGFTNFPGFFEYYLIP